MSARQRSQQQLPDTTRSSIAAIAVVVAIIIFVYLIRTVLIPFVFAGIIAYLCTPLVDWLAHRIRWPRWLFAVATVIVLLAFAALLAYLGIPPMLHEITRVTGDLQGTIKRSLQELIGTGSFRLLGNSIDANQISSYAIHAVQDWFNESGRVFSIASVGFAGIFGFILSWVVLAYLLIGGRQVADGLFWLVPPRHRRFVHKVWADLNPVLWRYFFGVALVVTYASLAAYLGLGVVLGLHHAVFLGLVTGLLEVVPIVGPAASAALGGLVAVQEEKSSWMIIAYAIYVTALRISIDEFFGPIVLGRAAYIRPVLVIFCFLAGADLFGIVGIVLAVPVALTIKAILAELYKDREAMTG
jgi:predicted PurR-regulated permease PerM